MLSRWQIYYRKQREFAFALLGNKCNSCGKLDTLQIDHIDPTTKIYTTKQIAGFGKVRLKEELKQCQLLCYECHKKKSDTAMGKTHCKRGHEFTLENTYNKRGKKECRYCRCKNAQDYRARKALSS